MNSADNRHFSLFLNTAGNYRRFNCIMSFSRFRRTRFGGISGLKCSNSFRSRAINIANYARSLRCLRWFPTDLYERRNGFIIPYSLKAF